MKNLRLEIPSILIENPTSYSKLLVISVNSINLDTKTEKGLARWLSAQGQWKKLTVGLSGIFLVGCWPPLTPVGAA